MRQISEERICKELTDPQLETAGWYLRDHSRVKIEIPAPPLSLQEEFAGVVARVEGMRGRNSPFEAREARRQACPERSRGAEGLFESVLSESFGG